VNERGFRHEVLFYADDDEFLEGAIPFLRDAIEAGGRSLVAVRRSRSELLRGELDADAGLVEFVDMEMAGRNPARIISVWQDFLAQTAGSSAPVRGIGEPVWPGRDPAELDECRRHEALLNLAFGRAREWSLLCPYDSAALDDAVLDAALESHPHAIRHGTGRPSAEWVGWDHDCTPFAGRLAKPPADATAIEFGRDGLAGVRKLIANEAMRAGLADGGASDMVTAVSELAANSVLHGGGHGWLRVWREPAALLAEAQDAGTIGQPLVGRSRPGVAQPGGRGLWLVNQLCDLVQIRSGADGTRVRLRMSLPE